MAPNSKTAAHRKSIMAAHGTTNAPKKQVCERCSRLKRGCDKARPACKKCFDAKEPCVYPEERKEEETGKGKAKEGKRKRKEVVLQSEDDEQGTGLEAGPAGLERMEWEATGANGGRRRVEERQETDDGESAGPEQSEDTDVDFGAANAVFPPAHLAPPPPPFDPQLLDGAIPASPAPQQPAIDPQVLDGPTSAPPPLPGPPTDPGFLNDDISAAPTDTINDLGVLYEGYFLPPTLPQGTVKPALLHGDEYYPPRPPLPPLFAHKPLSYPCFPQIYEWAREQQRGNM